MARWAEAARTRRRLGRLLHGLLLAAAVALGSGASAGPCTVSIAAQHGPSPKPDLQPTMTPSGLNLDKGQEEERRWEAKPARARAAARMAAQAPEAVSAKDLKEKVKEKVSLRLKCDSDVNYRDVRG